MQETPLAGSRIQRGRWNPGARTFELQLVAEGASGPVRVLLRYRNVGTLEPALPRLAALVEDVSLRVREHRAAGTAHGVVQTFAFAPAGEITIRSDSVERAESYAAPLEADTGFRFEVLSC